MDIKLGEKELGCIIDWYQNVHNWYKATEFEENLCDKLEDLRMFMIKNGSMFIHIGSEF